MMFQAALMNQILNVDSHPQWCGKVRGFEEKKPGKSNRLNLDFMQVNRRYLSPPVTPLNSIVTVFSCYSGEKRNS